MADETATSFSKTDSDPTPYIRTYAKDVARLTGSKPVASSHPAMQKEGPEAGVLLPDFDPTQSQRARGEEGPSPREFPQEILSVTAADTVANLNPDPVSREVNRDEILTRLRARVGKESAPPEPAPPVLPAQPQDSVATPPAQAFPAIPVPSAPEPVTPPPAPPVQAFPHPLPPPQPAPTPTHGFSLFSRHAAKAEPSDPAPSNLHTFKTDFADHIDEQKASTFSVLAAQGDSRDERVVAPKRAVISSKQNRLPAVIGSIAFFIFGAGLVGGAYWFVALRSPSGGTPFVVPSRIFADEKVEISGDTAAALAEAIHEVAFQTSVKGNVVVTYVNAVSEGKKGVIKSPQPGGPVIRKIFERAPDILVRNINDESTVGVINARDTNAPFFILDVSSYERTFAGMLGWEPTMAEDLAILYPPYLDAPQTSTTAPPIIRTPGFFDATVANHNVRMRKDSSGRTVLIYGYRDKQTLIIARDEAAFTAILVRLSAANGS